MSLIKWEPRYASVARHWDPFAELAGLRRMFDQPFESLFAGSLLEGSGAWRPRLDVAETKEAFLVKADIPGVKAEDIHIDVDDGTLTLRGERKLEEKVDEEGYSRTERHHGVFERSVLLPATVNADAVTATYANGVLEIRLPKKEEAKPKRIAVEAKA